jgi:hypothetical protein
VLHDVGGVTDSIDVANERHGAPNVAHVAWSFSAYANEVEVPEPTSPSTVQARPLEPTGHRARRSRRSRRHRPKPAPTRALIGLVCVGAAVAAVVDVWKANSGYVHVKAFGHVFSQPPWTVVAAGAVCGAVAVLGLGMVAAGGPRHHRVHAHRRAGEVQ